MFIKNADSQPVIGDVPFVWVEACEPILKFAGVGKSLPPPLSPDTWENKTFQCSILLIESDYSKLKSEVINLANYTHAKFFAPEEVQAKLALREMPSEGYWQLTFRQAAMYGKDPTRRKRSNPINVVGAFTQIQNGEKVSVDDEGTLIKPDTPIGNGTIGHLVLAPAQTIGGIYGYPIKIYVKHLVSRGSKSNDTGDLDSDLITELPAATPVPLSQVPQQAAPVIPQQAPQQAAPTVPPVAPAQSVKADPLHDLQEDIPF